jgi:DNA-binding CsgD family transcriptional regulator
MCSGGVVAVTIEQDGAADSDRHPDTAAITGVLGEAAREEHLADQCFGHVRAETIESLRAARASVRELLEREPSAPIAATIQRLRLLSEIEETRQRIEAREVYARLDTYVRVQEGLARLRHLRTAQELVEAAPAELLRTLGVSRAMVSRVRGSLWTPEVLAVKDGIDPEEVQFQAFVAETEIPLAHMLMETELVRRRVPVLVSDPFNDPRTHKPIVEVSRWTSYAAAPIMPSTTRVIGFFHIDRFGQGLPVSSEDRDNLWAFAELFGLLYERSVLVERLELQRTELHRLLSDTGNSIDKISEADVTLVRAERTPHPPTGQAPSARSPVGLLLTDREQEILELMALGATNSQIARELVVSEGTVKSHLKRIFRKLRVDSRASAVARYLQLIRRSSS